jgi:hypothetical protein
MAGIMPGLVAPPVVMLDARVFNAVLFTMFNRP